MSRSLEELRELADRDAGGADGESTAASDDASVESPASDTAPNADGGAEGSARTRLGRVPFSARGFLLTFATLVVGLVAGSAVPFVGGITRYAGLFAAAFALGLVRSRRAYLETAVAGALAAGGAFVLGTLATGTLILGTNLLADYGVPIAGVGVAVGVLLSLAGVYFGRDLRNGLTREIE